MTTCSVSITLRLLAYSFFSVAATVTGSAADSVILKNGNTLTGEITDSDTLGILALKNSETKSPIKIRETSVSGVTYEPKDSKESNLKERIRLINGDEFLCSIIELDDESVTFESDVLGYHQVAREKVSQISFNTEANKRLYQGPGDDLSAWNTTTEDWKLNDGKLISTSMSQAAISIEDLTDNYILEFKTDWNGSHPHVSISFSSDTKAADKKSDYYNISLNSYGITISRSNLGKLNVLTQILANESIYGQPSIHVAIHVDRKNKKLALYLNGKRTKIITDKDTPPTGSSLVITNRQRKGVLTQIRDIKISSWGGKVTKNIDSKGEILTKHDLITELSGNVITGKVVGLSNTEGKLNLNFIAPFAKDNSKMPSSALDLLEFQTPSVMPNLEESTYHLNLVSGGLISFTNSQMIGGKLTIIHPILGKISIAKTELSKVVMIPKTIK